VREHGRTASDALAFLSERFATSLLVWLLVGIALALPAGLWLVELNLTRMSAGWEGRPGLSVYFLPGYDDVEPLVVSLRARPEVEAVTVTTRAQALDEFRTETGLADALDLLEDNPLPASLRATLVVGATPADLDVLAALARGGAGVGEVVVEKTWLERVADLSSVVSRLGLILAGLFGVGAVLVTATSVRLAIEARLEELKVLKLVGGTERQLRRPFLYFGALYGVGGGLVAAMLLSLGLVVIEVPLARLLGSYDRALAVEGFGAGFLGALLLSGAGLGVAGALLAARQRIAGLEIL
jgi:cell division transport system permease protein